MTKKRAICIILACVLLLGTLSVGVITYAWDDDAETPHEDEAKQVSDYFYMQIYNSEDQIVAKYKVTLTGTVSGASREITAVSFSHESGDACETNYEVDGDTAYVTITHPTEGYLLRIVTLNASGSFLAY